MRRFNPLIAAFAVSLSLSTFASAQVTTDPVGFLTLNVKGTTGFPAGTTSALSFLGLAFTQPVSYQATFTANGAGTTLTDSNATWVDNQFNGANGNFYVELITGTGAGKMSQITATSGSGKTITTADDLSSFVVPGTGYKIRKNWTVGTVFGPADESGLQGGTSTTADEILVLNQSTGLYTTYYYKTSGVGGTGWRSTASTSIDAANGFFKPTDGLLVRRHQTPGSPPTASPDISFALAGAVKLGQTSSPIASGLNIVSNPYPSGTFTLGTSGLQASGILAGSSTTADTILVLNQATGLYTTYYLKSGGVGGNGWRSTNSTSVDESTAAIPFGASIIIQRKAGSTLQNWVAPQPF